jgi:hypothetical protein
MRENKLQVFENKVLRKVSGARRDKVSGKFRILQFGDLCRSLNIIREIK